MRIRVTYVPEEKKFNAEEWYDVDGKSDEEDISWALEYTEWERWLGYEVDWETYNKYDKEFVIAHCLWEMTWSGYSQRSIQQRRKEMDSEVDEIGEAFEEALVNDEIEQITWEELFGENKKDK